MKVSEKIGRTLYILKVDNESETIRSNYDSLPVKIWDKVLFVINEKKLVTIDTFNSEPGYYLRNFVQFPDQNLVYFVEEEYKNFERTMKYNISFFDYKNDSLTLRRIKSTDISLFKNFFYDPFSFVRGENIYVCNNWEYDLKNDKVTRYAFDRYFNRVEVNYNDAHNIYAFGVSGYQQQLVFSYKYPFNDFSKLKIAWDRDYEKMPDSRFQLPKHLIDYSYNRLYIEANSNKYMLGNIGSMLIYTKKKRSWDTLTIKGERQLGRLWNDWIYGTNIGRSIASSDDESIITLLKKTYNNGVMDDTWLRDNSLFLYHIPSKKFIEWKPKNGDSEIIQIIDGYIYYRVFDELRKVKLDEKILNIDWSTDELIVKNKDIIPYVHHIFFSNTTQTKYKEIWVNKPKKK